MSGTYLCRFYIQHRLVEEEVYASSPFQAKRIIDARYGDEIRWSGPPNLAANSSRWLK